MIRQRQPTHCFVKFVRVRLALPGPLNIAKGRDNSLAKLAKRSKSLKQASKRESVFQADWKLCCSIGKNGRSDQVKVKVRIVRSVRLKC